MIQVLNKKVTKSMLKFARSSQLKTDEVLIHFDPIKLLNIDIVRDKDGYAKAVYVGKDLVTDEDLRIGLMSAEIKYRVSDEKFFIDSLKPVVDLFVKRLKQFK